MQITSLFIYLFFLFFNKPVAKHIFNTICKRKKAFTHTKYAIKRPLSSDLLPFERRKKQPKRSLKKRFTGFQQFRIPTKISLLSEGKKLLGDTYSLTYQRTQF